MQTTISENLKRLMEEKGFKVKQFAEAAGSDERMMYRYRNGTKRPQRETVESWAKILKVPYEEIDPNGDAYSPGAPVDTPPQPLHTAGSASNARHSKSKSGGEASSMAGDWFDFVRAGWPRLSARRQRQIVRIVTQGIEEALEHSGYQRRASNASARRS